MRSLIISARKIFVYSALYLQWKKEIERSIDFFNFLYIPDDNPNQSRKFFQSLQKKQNSVGGVLLSNSYNNRTNHKCKCAVYCQSIIP